MNRAAKLLSLLCSLLLICTSCLEIVPPEAENHNITEEAASSDPVGSTEDATTVASVVDRKPIVDPDPLPKRTFDRNEIYRHVFEQQSELLTEEEMLAKDVDLANGETLVCFAFDISGDVAAYSEYYFTEHFQTETVYETDMKYRTQFFYLSPGTMATGYVRNDYHEAYLDVMFDNLTFSACDEMPAHEDLVYTVGMIYADQGSYYVCSNGHLYYVEKQGDEELCFKSDQTVDSAYLSTILLLPYLYENERKSIYDPYRNYFNFDEIAEIKIPYQLEEKNETKRYFLEDGSVYCEWGPNWIFVEHIAGISEGAVSFYVDRTIYYPYGLD